ncbi:hypothetical protein [Plantibacter sp. 2H11-2]|uniref:hypothetical protein n=1 Tax=Plantibacter sp. 2H11-2 TaxID=3414431 RepID=UPI003CEAB446
MTAALVLGPALVAPAASAAAVDCATVDRAVQVTADCIDPLYANPVVDSVTDETTPIPNHHVSGHFEGTNIQFNIHLHSLENKVQWQGRFFQSVYPIAFTADENTARVSDRNLGFALSSGGYAVAAGNGQVSVGYRHAAAAAKFARQVAAEYYGSDSPIFGYLFGGSGGSLQTVGAAENTQAVWQGFVPTIQAVQQPTSYNFLGRAAASLILSDQALSIRAALVPGGSGDPYATLDEAQRAMFAEVTALGIPLKGWEYPDYLLGNTSASGISTEAPLSADPTYVDDFWNTAGYLGTEQSPLGERVREKLAQRGDTLSNRWDIANKFYYRYQLPAEDDGWVGLDQFRAEDGTPLYPQRSVAATISTAASGNAKFDGSISGKLIAVSDLYDTDALPWHTDWYRKQVEASLGSIGAEENYRVYFQDHADHQGPPVPGDERSKHLVDPFGGVEQALRDVAAWAEDGVTPPDSTQYSVENAQIVVADNASERHGVQPTVELTANGDQLAAASVGQPVAFKARVTAPAGTGSIVSAEWDFDGDGVFTDAPLDEIASETTIEAAPVFDTPGTFLVALRVTSVRDGDPTAQFARIQNLDRVQVVVTADCATAGPEACGPITAGTPAIGGDIRVGSVLTVAPGSWDPTDVALSYQWLADGEPIAGATGETFDVTAAQLGARLSVTVTGTKEGFTSASATTAETAAVVAAAPSTSPPVASPPAADPSVTDTSKLAKTGVEVPLTAAGIALALLAVGAFALVRSRRARKHA